MMKLIILVLKLTPTRNTNPRRHGLMKNLFHAFVCLHQLTTRLLRIINVGQPEVVLTFTVQWGEEGGAVQAVILEYSKKKKKRSPVSVYANVHNRVRISRGGVCCVRVLRSD